jgi:protease II
LNKVNRLTTPVMNFEDIERIEDLEQVSEESVWQNFERLAAFIFEKNDFTVKVNTVRTLERKRRQYDVIARKRDRTFLVECKKWAGNRYRLSALKRAILQHKERTVFYEHITHEEAVPVIVTLIEEEIRVYDGVPIVPVLRLNAFIAELDNHAEGKEFSRYEEELPVPDDLPDEPWESPETGDTES